MEDKGSRGQQPSLRLEELKGKFVLQESRKLTSKNVLTLKFSIETTEYEVRKGGTKKTGNH